MFDDTRLISNVVSLLKLTTSDHDIYKSPICNYDKPIYHNFCAGKSYPL